MTLDKFDFINRIISMYPNAIKNEGYDAYYDSYKRVLSNKIDFEKLFDIFCLEHNTNYPPTAAWLKEKSILCLKKEIEQSTWLQVKIYNPIYDSISSFDCFPKGTSKETMIKTYEKITKVKGWKVLEVF